MAALKRGVSNIGKNATFGTPEEEITRIIKFKTNYYVCLKVLPDTDAAEIRTNYLKLSRKCHPDKNPGNPQAAEASSVLNAAKDTLTNPMKKKLYDAYVTDVTSAGGEGPEMTYADWEAAQAAYPVRLPKWLEKVLSIPLLGQIIALIILILLIPLLLVAVALGLVLYCLCLPLNILARCCCGPPRMDAETEAEREAFADAAGAAPQAQTASRGADAV